MNAVVLKEVSAPLSRLHKDLVLSKSWSERLLHQILVVGYTQRAGKWRARK